MGHFGGRVDGVALTGRRLPVSVGNAGLDGIRRTRPSWRRPAPHGATSPRHRANRNPHGVRWHRPGCGQARADFTSPCTCWSAGGYIWDIPLSAGGGPGPGWAARRGARLVAGPFPRGLPPEPRWRLSTHVALWDLRRAVGGCPWIASWQARQTIRVLRRICAVFAAQAGCPGAGVAELGDYRHRAGATRSRSDLFGTAAVFARRLTPR